MKRVKPPERRLLSGKISAFVGLQRGRKLFELLLAVERCDFKGERLEQVSDIGEDWHGSTVS